MKKVIVLMLSMVMSLQLVYAEDTQDIEVKRFEKIPQNLMARTNPINDITGVPCAVFRCFVRGKDYKIEPNFGILKTEEFDGEIRLWVPQGTKRMTIRRKGLKPLIDYEIPMQVESKAVYEIDIVDKTAEESKHIVYAGAGYNIISISGPSIAVGAKMKHHIIELGAVYGMNKTDNLFYYNSEGKTIAGYQYNAIRVDLRYGYDFPISDFFSVIPQAGIACHAYIGEDVANINGKDFKNGVSLAFLGGVRMSVSFSKVFKLNVTSEYDVAFFRDNACKYASKYDKTMKNWKDGFNLNVGLVYIF